MSKLEFSKYQNNVYVHKVRGNDKEPLKIRIPRVECVKELDGKNGKYYLIINNVMRDFLEMLDSQSWDYLGNTVHFQPLAKYRSIKIKLPYRYKKFEVDVYKDGGLETIYDIKKGDFLDITIELKNIWMLEEKGELGECKVIAGYLWVAKSITIIE